MLKSLMTRARKRKRVVATRKRNRKMPKMPKKKMPKMLKPKQRNSLLEQKILRLNLWGAQLERMKELS